MCGVWNCVRLTREERKYIDKRLLCTTHCCAAFFMAHSHRNICSHSLCRDEYSPQARNSSDSFPETTFCVWLLDSETIGLRKRCTQSRPLAPYPEQVHYVLGSEAWRAEWAEGLWLWFEASSWPKLTP